MPVGEDQVQHLEFAKHCADQFNAIYGEVLVRPKAVLCTQQIYALYTLQSNTISDLPTASAKRVMSLKDPHLKMSKSHNDENSRIHINDPPQVIGNKIRLALTDSMTGVSYDPTHRPGLSNLLAILSYLDIEQRTAEDLALSYSHMNMREFKVEVTRLVSEGLASVRERYNSLIKAERGGFLDEIAMDGSIKAGRAAKENMATIRQAVGF